MIAPKNLTDMKPVQNEPSAAEIEVIEALLKYPALESVYDRNAAAGFSGIRQRMQATLTDLERVVRRGDRASAERAARIVTAYNTTLAFLNELERIGKNQSQ